MTILEISNQSKVSSIYHLWISPKSLTYKENHNHSFKVPSKPDSNNYLQTNINNLNSSNNNSRVILSSISQHKNNHLSLNRLFKKYSNRLVKVWTRTKIWKWLNQAKTQQSNQRLYNSSLHGLEKIMQVKKIWWNNINKKNKKNKKHKKNKMKK